MEIKSPRVKLSKKLTYFFLFLTDPILVLLVEMNYNGRKNLIKNYVLYIQNNVGKYLYRASFPQFQEYHCHFKAIYELLREPCICTFLKSLKYISILSSMFNDSIQQVIFK